MFDTLQSLSVVTIINETVEQKTLCSIPSPVIAIPPAAGEARHCEQREAIGKPAVVIPINTDIKIISSGNKAPQKLPFEKWNLPAQEEGYIKGKSGDFL